MGSDNGGNAGGHDVVWTRCFVANLAWLNFDAAAAAACAGENGSLWTPLVDTVVSPPLGRDSAAWNWGLRLMINGFIFAERFTGVCWWLSIGWYFWNCELQNPDTDVLTGGGSVNVYGSSASREGTC